MTDRTAPLKELLAAAKFEPECGDTIHRQGCEQCESPKAEARWEARRKLIRLGYTNDRVGRTAADALIASSNALEKAALRGHRMAGQLERESHRNSFEDCGDGFCPAYQAVLASVS